MRRTLSLIFFLSGAAALLFETLWFRLAGLALGNSVWSASLVLAAFMAGIAAGNAAVAGLDGRITRPLRAYAALEVAIGVAGAAVVLALSHTTGFLGSALGVFVETPWVLNGLRLGLGFCMLLIPAAAMGATLPVLALALSRSDPNFGATLGTLYGWNTLGATLGALAGEAALIEWLGVTGSGLTAALLNLAAAAIALSLSRSREGAGAVAPAVAKRSRLSARTARYLAAGLLSGAIMLALEVVWFRFLLLSHHGTSLVFAIMLAVVLAGIAAGGLAAARWYRFDERAHAWLGQVTAAGGLCVVLTYAGFDLFTVYQIQNDTTLIESAAFAAFLMLPVSVLSGIAFTMVGRAVKDDLGSAARAAGVATCCNTVGAMLGPLIGGFILLPLIGMERSFFVLAASYGLVALVVPREPSVVDRRLAWTAGAALAASLVLFPFGLMQRSYFQMVQSTLPGHRLIETREGLTETAFYFSYEQYGQPLYHRLVTNGFSMSATGVLARRYMKLFVYLPLALDPDARDALLISYGVGSTAKALTDTRSIRHIDVVDISRDILEMSSIVYDDADNPLEDPRVRVHVEDGRFFLGASDARYDLITSEPPPPKVAGVVNLYSQEHFELIHSRLRPGGYATYWLPVHQLEPLETLAITRAFCNAFPDCSLWAGAGLDWILMGSNGAVSAPSLEEFTAQWADPEVERELIALGFETPAQLGALFMGDAAYLAALTERVPPVTDNYPLRISSRHAYAQGHVPLYATLMDEDERLLRFRESAFIERLWPAELRTASEPYFAFERMIKSHITAGAYREPSSPFLWEAVDRVLTETSLETLPLWLLGSDADAQRAIDRLRDREGRGAGIELELSLRYLASREYGAALTHLDRYMAQATGTPPAVRNLHLFLLGQDGRLAEAAAQIASLRSRGHGVERFLDWFAARFALEGHEARGEPVVSAQ